MKKILLILCLLMSTTLVYAQEEESSKVTTFEKFLSKTGTFVRLTEYKLPDVVKEHGSHMQ